MDSKLNLINSYIQKCDEIIQSQNFHDAKMLFLEILSVFENEIPQFINGMESEIGRNRYGWKETNQYWLSDLPIVKAKLLNYAATLETKVSPSRPAINIVNNNTANAIAQNTIDFEVTIKNAQKTISEMESLSVQDTQEALKKLDELVKIAKSSEPRKSKWSKIGSALKWLADKSVELAVAFAPALMQVIRGL